MDGGATGGTMRRVAFLRGINLGSRRVKMARLREHLEDLGLAEVDTYRASGNVVFGDSGAEPAVLEEEIEEHLEESLGYEVRTFVRSLPGLERLAALDLVGPARDDGCTPYVIFRRDEAGREVADALRALETPDDAFRLHGREVLWLRRGRLTDSSIGTRDLEDALGGPDHTRRKLTTVEGIVSKFGEAAG